MKNHKMWYRVDPPTVDMEDYIWSIDGKYKIYDTETGEWKELSQEDPVKKAIYTFIIYLSVTKGLIPESPEFSKHCKVVVVNGEAKLLDQYYFNSKEWYSISSGLSDGTTAYWTVDNRLHTEDNNEDVYYSIIMIDGFGNILNASTPENLKGTQGEQGKPGVDGSVIEYLYKRFKTLDEAELAIPPVSKDDDGWTEEPKGVNATFRVEVVSDRKRDIESGEWSDWSDPVVWATYSDDGLDGTTYKEFKVYTLVPDYLSVPKTPTGGTWSPGNERLLHLPVDPDGIYEWTDIAPQANEKYAWYSTAVFRNSDGAKDSNWTPPVRYGSIPVEVDKYYRYYQAFNKETLDPEDIPSLNDDPIDKGWSLENDIRLSEDLKYLWSFERVTYSTDQTFQTAPVILKQYIADVDYEIVKEYVKEEIEDEINAVDERLSTVEETDVLIKNDPEHGLYALLTSYKDKHQTSFADFTANAAVSTIKSFAGSYVDEVVNSASQTLNGLEGWVRTMATTVDLADGMTVSSALQTIKSDAITQSVTKGKWYWQRQVHDPESEIIDPTVEGYWIDDEDTTHEITAEYNPEFGENGQIIDERKPECDGVTYNWDKRLFINSMSAIKQESNSIKMLIGDNESCPLASFVVHAINDNRAGEIILSADNIRLNGQVIARAINADSITIGKKDQETGQWLGGYAILGPEGLMASGAKIIGNLYSGEGFFGYYEEDENTHQITTRTGVHIGIMGSDNDTEGTGGLWSSNYHVNQSGFLLGGEHFEFYGQNGSYIKDTDLKLAQGTIGGITITPTELQGTESVDYFIVHYEGDKGAYDYAIFKDGLFQRTAFYDLLDDLEDDNYVTCPSGGWNVWIVHTFGSPLTLTKVKSWCDNHSSWDITYREETNSTNLFGFSMDRTSGSSICAWFGGIKEDRAVSSENPVDAAKILFRYDGSGYLASNKLKWDTNGNLIIDSGAVIGPFILDNGFLYENERYIMVNGIDYLYHNKVSIVTDELTFYQWRAKTTDTTTYDDNFSKADKNTLTISPTGITSVGRKYYSYLFGLISGYQDYKFSIDKSGGMLGFTHLMPSGTTPFTGDGAIAVGDDLLQYGGIKFDGNCRIHFCPTKYTPGQTFWIFPGPNTTWMAFSSQDQGMYLFYSNTGHWINSVGNNELRRGDNYDDFSHIVPFLFVFGPDHTIYGMRMSGAD